MDTDNMNSCYLLKNLNLLLQNYFTKKASDPEDITGEFFLTFNMK